MPEPVSIAERVAIDEVLGRYFLAVDTGDVETVLAQFTADALVRYGDGTRYEGPAQLREFALRAIGGPEACGRMHVNRPLFAERLGGDILLRSYLMVPHIDGSDRTVTLATLRYIEDRFRLTDAGWRIRERAIFPWDDDARKRARTGYERPDRLRTE